MPHFQKHFIDWKILYFGSNFTETCPRGLINNKSAFVQRMSWHRTGDKPVSEAWFISVVYMRQRIEAETKWPPFCRRYFEMDFLEWNCMKFDWRLFPINNILALVQNMAWRRTGDKPSSELKMVSLLTHIRVSRPQWVNSLAPGGCGSSCFLRIHFRIAFFGILLGNLFSVLWPGTPLMISQHAFR